MRVLCVFSFQYIERSFHYYILNKLRLLQRKLYRYFPTEHLFILRPKPIIRLYIRTLSIIFVLV